MERPVAVFAMRMAWLLPGVLLAGAVQSAEHPCAEVPDPEQRLACYDRAFPPSESVREAARQRVLDRFGRQEPPPPMRDPAAPPQADEADRITSTITRVVHANGGRTITLDNGQIWTLTEATMRGPTNEGDEVTVRKGAMGSYILVTAAGVGLRVKRVR